MPRERVHHGKQWAHKEVPETENHSAYTKVVQFEPAMDPADYDKITEDPSLEVNWSREYGHVQVSIDFSREQWLACAKDLEDNPDIIRKAIYTDALSRKDINDMIRTLRRARDAAYGRDE